MAKKILEIRLPSPLLQRFGENRNDKASLYTNYETLHEDIRCNLEKLLNSHSTFLTWPSHYNELDESMWNYGITDFSHYRYNDEAGRVQLCGFIQSSIERFEPRLSQVNVILLENDDEIERILQIRIEGVMNLNSISESTVFESKLDLKCQFFDVE